MTVGSYNESVMVAGKSNLAISAPVQSGKSGMTELTTPQTLLITDCYRFRLSGLTIHGMTTINGAVLRHQFKNCNFNGGLTISSVAPITEWITFSGVVYFYRCNFQNATFTLSPTFASTQIVLFECQGIPVDIRDPSVLSFFPLGTSSYYLSGTLESSEIQSKIFLHTTTPTLDNQVTSKIYVDSEITSATTDVAYRSTGNVFTGADTFADLSTTNNTPVGNQVVTKNYLDTETVLKADLLSPAFTGSPSLPTASTAITQIVGDNSTKLATTAFVLANGGGGGGGGDAYLGNAQTFTALNDFTGGLTSSVAPTTNLEVANKVFVDSAITTATSDVAYKSTANVFSGQNDFTGDLSTTNNTPVGNNVITKQYLDTQTVLKADIASPTFTGAPSLPTASTAITQSVGDNTTKLATTAFVLANAGGSEFVAFRANSTTTATITISAGNGEVTSPLDNTSLGGAFDTHGLWDNSTHRFTADRTGYWEITWKFYSNWTNLAYTANFSLRRIRAGVTTVLLITGKAVMITTDCTGLFLLEDGDQLYITHGGNASLNYNYGQTASFFQGRFISA